MLILWLNHSDSALLAETIQEVLGLRYLTSPKEFISRHNLFLIVINTCGVGE